jgi:hypothetical protein
MKAVGGNPEETVRLVDALTWFQEEKNRRTSSNSVEFFCG